MARKAMRQNRRIRKRIFVIAGVTLLAVALVGSLVAYYASTLVGPADLVRFAVTEGESRSAVLGSGISLSQVESANLLQDSSFEPIVFRQALTVFSGDATTLTVSSEEASEGLYGDGFFDGASARVMTQDENGMLLKKTAKVAHYGINRVGVFTSLNLPGDVPDRTAILSFARLGDLTVAVGRKGLVIRNVTGSMPEVAESGILADLTGVCASQQGFLACSKAGDVLYSNDGLAWSSLAGYNTSPLAAIAASDEGVIAAVGADGLIVAGSVTAPSDVAAVGSGITTMPAGQIVVLQTGIQADLNDIAYGLATFVAIGDDGTILISKTGLIWQTVTLPEDVSWQAIDFRDGRFALAGSDGAIALSDDGRTFRLVAGPVQLNGESRATDLADIVMLSRQQLIALDQEGGFAVSNDSGENWLKSSIDTGMNSTVIALAGKDMILSADSAGKLGLADLVAEIQLDSPLKDGQYRAGDQIFLEKTAVEVPASYLAATDGADTAKDPWNFYGQGQSRRDGENASPGGGTASMRLEAAADSSGASAILSQVIDPDRLEGAKANETFRIELWMKQSDVTDRTVQAWLSGPFSSVGTSFANVGSTWKKYSFTLVLPLWAAGTENRDIRLNFAVRSGSVWIDQANFSRVGDEATLLARSFRSQVDMIAPQFIRLDFLQIGSRSVRQDSWSHLPGNETPSLSALGRTVAGCGSLYTALRLVEDSGADPWLVIDSFASESELLNLIEYLAGPISEPLGRRRQEQGQVIPWTEQFNRILIEITDSNGLFNTDRQRADYVDLLIRTITQSPYYRQIKGQMVFIDSMAYSDGVMLSTADYHATTLGGLIAPDRPGAITAAYLDYYDKIPRNPEKPVQSWLELIRSASLHPNGTNLPDLADLTELCLRDLGVQSTLSNLDLPGRFSQEWQACWPVAANIAAAAARGIPLEISASPASQSGQTSDLAGRVFARGFASSTQTTIVLTNLADRPATCQILTDLPLQNATITKYDADGTLLGQQILRQRDGKISILPGGVVVITKKEG